MDILDRIQYLMKLNNLTASSFADKIDIQRSTMSHLLSGRNKPSLDFITKVLEAFPKISADWLLYGKKEVENIVSEKEVVLENDILEKNNPASAPIENSDKQIKKIVVFYTDNTFEEFKNNN